MSSVPVLIRVNYLLRIPGHPGEFSTADMRYDSEGQALLIRTPTLGVLRFTSSDDITVRVLDLNVPTILRNQQKDEGWEDMTMPELLHLIRCDYVLNN